jgi:hypothetical protein
MASEGTFTVPRMGSFKRALLGYRRQEVNAAIEKRDVRISALERNVKNVLGQAREAADAAVQAEDEAAAAKVLAAQAEETAANAERELASLSGMVIEREREIRHLVDRLREANQRHDRSIASLETTAGRLDEIQAQARGQATRIRMKALREAAEVSRRTQEFIDGQDSEGNGAAAPADSNGAGALDAAMFEGLVKVEIGPLDDFSQLVGFEDAIGNLGASEISIERFSEGRATLSMKLDEPVELLRELEERAPLDFRVRRTSDDNLILDVDEDQGPEQRAA